MLGSGGLGRKEEQRGEAQRGHDLLMNPPRLSQPTLHSSQVTPLPCSWDFSLPHKPAVAHVRAWRARWRPPGLPWSLHKEAQAVQGLWETVLSLQRDNRCLDHVTCLGLHLAHIPDNNWSQPALCWLLYKASMVVNPCPFPSTSSPLTDYVTLHLFSSFSSSFIFFFSFLLLFLLLLLLFPKIRFHVQLAGLKLTT